MTELRIALDYAASSDRGLVRTNNEDSAYAGPRLLALADGMGGHAAGEVASAFLIESLRPLDSPLIEEPDHKDRLTTMLASAAEQGNQHIASHVDENPQLQGMGCTLTSILFRNNEAAICHVGDSRAYLLRDGQLHQLTKDDTFVQSLVDEGKLDAADASSHPQRSLILKALTGRVVELSLQTLEAHPGDRFMLCSDGLSDPVSFETMTEILADGDPQRTAHKLVEMALRGGGPDNVTVVVADAVDISDSSEKKDASPSQSELPTSPVLVGAVAPEQNQSQWFDTPAARAAASGASVTSTWQNRETDDAKSATDAVGNDGSNGAADGDGQPTAVPPAVSHTDTEQSPGDGDAGQDGDGVPKKKKKKKTGWIVGGIALVVIIALVAGGAVGYKRLKETYFVAVEDQQIVVKNGMQGSVLGISLNSTHQHVCLNKASEIQLVSSDDADSCHNFETSDLSPSARSTIESMPEDSYQAVVDQINRLAEQTLPVCVTRSPKSTDAKDDKSAKDSKDPRKPTESAEATGSAEATTSSTRTKSSAPEDLTTPGVSCREVK